MSSRHTLRRAQMQDPKTLEPAGGDYVTYLDKLLSGKERKLEPLSVSSSDGMVKVQSAKEVAADAAVRQAQLDAWMAQRKVRQQAAMAQLGAVFGMIFVIAGVISIIVGAMTPDLEPVCIPFGMIAIFAGTVTSAHSRQAARRQRK